MNFSIFLLIAGLILLSPTPTGLELGLRNFMVVWNVGQGQWATLKDSEGCHHFDMGGERSPLKTIQRLCGREKNFIHLSHWDWDHISFVQKSARVLRERCLALGPVGTANLRKTRLLEMLPRCEQKERLEIDSMTRFDRKNFLTVSNPPKLNSNDASHVLLAEDQFLIPGDSSTSQEKIWSKDPELAKTKWLLLGHHGSRTSTSLELLKRLPRLKTAVASARLRRYGHPHPEVVAKLRHFGVPLLRTEDWGNLWFEYRGKAPANSRNR